MEDEDWDFPEDEAPVDPVRPPGMSNSNWALTKLGHEKPQTYWGWTREYRRQP